MMLIRNSGIGRELHQVVGALSLGFEPFDCTFTFLTIASQHHSISNNNPPSTLSLWQGTIET